MCRAGEKGIGMNWRTHDVFNQFSELSDYNLLTTDSPCDANARPKS
jgi:hypothetical protein